MSLKIYYEGIDVLPDRAVVARDVEHLFGDVILDGNDYDCRIIKAIEQGEYLDDTRFVDRFRTPLYLDCLSTGAKAALSLYHIPDVIIWCGEIGCNALTQMIKYCTRGAILVRGDHHFVYGSVEDVTIDVDSLTFNDVRKTDIAELLNSRVVDLVMFDRYDMYPGKFLQEISKFAETGIVLVDSKTYDFPFQVEPCCIYLHENRLVVM